MYTEAYLSSFPFFRDILRSTELSAIHDSLTGLVARPYMIRFIHDLIERGTPFTLAIFDLDNFKSVNDNYGHKVGDGVLSRIACDLRGYVGEDGLVGRYGGDEFLVLYFKSNDYDDVHSFYEGMFYNDRVLRKKITADGISLFVTATIGSASFPDNAEGYESLFALVDKALYRGKSKGRNCYIIYVEAKHKDLEIPKLAKHSLYETFRLMTEGFDGAEGAHQKLRAAFAPIRDNLRLYALFYANTGGALIDGSDGSVLGQIEQMDRLPNEDLYTPNLFDDLKDYSPVLYESLLAKGFHSALLVRIRSGETDYGRLVICPEPHTMRIWQDEEYAAVFFLARMLAQYLTAQGETLG